MSPQSIAVVVGSTRPGRICLPIARAVRDRLPSDGAVSYEVLDLADVDLPFLDEPIRPALHEYLHEHTRLWSALVQERAGFVFVFPQYNWGYPAVLKNALDFLYTEWRDKPATTVTYGTHGGARGADQLAEVLKGLHMHHLEDRLEVAVSPQDVDVNGQLRDVDALLTAHGERLRRIDGGFREVLSGAAGSAEAS